MFERVDRLVTANGFTLKSWSDRYAKGVWVVCTQSSCQADEVQEASEDGDLDMIAATDFVRSTDWLPVVTGRTFVEALSALEARLATLEESELCQGSRWASSVWDAMEQLRDVRRGSKDYGDCDGKFPKLPEKLQELQASWTAVTAD